MKKALIVHIVVIVVAVVIGYHIAAQLHKQQLSIFPSKALLSSAPIGGFHKFASDVEWMLFINYMGNLKSVEKDNCDEVVRRLEKIISLDPNFDKAYQVGVMSISVASPEQAVSLLKKACDNADLKDNWKLPFYAGFILTHCLSEEDKKDPSVVQKRTADAVTYYDMAIRRSSKPENYVINAYLRAMAKAKAFDASYKNNDKLAMLDILYSEWKKQKDSREMMESSLVPDLHPRILKVAQELREEFPEDAASKEMIKKVLEDVFANQHICMKCLTPYVAGDKFCTSCGADVTVYGICKGRDGKCGAILKGSFCHICGTKAEKVSEPLSGVQKKELAAPSPKEPVSKGKK